MMAVAVEKCSQYCFLDLLSTFLEELEKALLVPSLLWYGFPPGEAAHVDQLLTSILE